MEYNLDILKFEGKFLFILRPCGSRSGWEEDAQVLPIWRHRKHRISTRNNRRR